MGKRLLAVLLLLLGTVAASAVPAAPGKFMYTQPDGTVVTLQRHGDEHFNWTTDAAGRMVRLSESGFWEEELLPGHLLRKQQALAVRSRMVVASYENHPVTNHGDRKILCLLANFTDSTFVIDNPRSRFSRMLNERGYSDDGATGSVRDYYMDNSLGDYRPEFDVYGPVTLSGSSAHYDKVGVGKAILEAYDLLSDQINLSDYDTDGDGDVDMVLFYYPGHNEAEGGGVESIWPHQLNAYFGMRDGIVFNQYFCSSELRGRTGTQMCGIGTTCHEFAHSLGLPDFYDTNYEADGSNDVLTDRFDLMDSGCYNDRGRRPPYLSALERNMLGWMENLSELPTGAVSIGPVRTNTGYYAPGNVEGEYFILECRDNYKWDSALSDYGLLIYHVDKSSRSISDRYTAASSWNHNIINAIGGHPCYYLLKSGNYQFAFPGVSSVSALLVKDWDEEAALLLNGISFDGETASFRARSASSTVIFGTVRNDSGAPLSGARVSLRKSAHPFHAPALRAVDDAVVTGDDGYYEFVLGEDASREQILSVQCDGYTPLAMNVSVESPLEKRDITLPRIGEGSVSFSDYGIASIRESGDEFLAVPPSGKTVYRIEWYLDGSPVETPPAPTSLPAGLHTLMARFTYYDGTSDRVFLEKDVE